MRWLAYGLLALVVAWYALHKLERVLAARYERRQYQRRRREGRAVLEAADVLGRAHASTPGYWQLAVGRRMREDRAWQPRETKSNDR